MTDAEKLHDSIIGLINEHMTLTHAQTVANNIVSLLPPIETIAAIKAGTWKAVPKKITEDMAAEMECAFSTERQWDNALAAAPEKPD